MSMLLFGACTKNANFATVSGASLDNLWTINDTTGDIEPFEVDFFRTVRVNDLVIQNGSTLTIGGIKNGTPFATISTEEFFFPAVNGTKNAIIITRDVFMTDFLNGTKLLTNLNLDFSANSSAITSAGDPLGNGMILQKFNENHRDPFRGVVASLRGNVEIMTTRDNNVPLTGVGNNNISIGFYKNLTVTLEGDLNAYTEKNFVISMNQTAFNIHKTTFIDREVYFNQTYTPNMSSPPTKIGNIGLFARDDNNLYIIRDNGQIKRLSAVGSGSSVFSEIVKFNNHTSFFGNIYLNNTVYNGGGVGYACIDNIGRIFKSIAPCSVTSETFIKGNISDPTLGDEVQNNP